MPEMQNYLVTQIREVSIVANNVVDAVRIAEAAFENDLDKDRGIPGVWGYARSRVKTTDLHASREW